MTADCFDKMKKKLRQIVVHDSISKIKQYEESKIIAVEEELHIKLPKDYRSFILNYGNFVASEEYAYKAIEPSPWAPKDGFETVDFFYGLDDDENGLKYNIKLYNHQINESVIPIASSPGDNQICIGLKGDYYGKIYFWDHESEDEKDLYLIANSFCDFIISFKKHKINIDVDLDDIEIKFFKK